MLNSDNRLLVSDYMCDTFFSLNFAKEMKIRLSRCFAAATRDFILLLYAQTQSALKDIFESYILRIIEGVRRIVTDKAAFGGLYWQC